ncbi:hypothetical protein A2962_01685 [Candidatus Woesebacteria bacterium RIFCSPLOWO2_01_FULL_39_61]|uniref:R3H domain-containing protein n=1 Tax=Candidatus Woesebacteria bacterium RIFCSPHIGHO2_02_FULL_39_13 TaxID=1802505 RepID=A0A1F7Z706_9BACT|nr:MAG: hypothetical protein A2692_01925 [Candidatus Woesebacteria bacterium RIFCSPHIGHO2_01_FULL_39_95]OGM34555.1 MAG: hypothetical protein A3D01_03375 [Candidatus Woesebacteria bacterium RIFCSPHIGHO2_02_FULL_39_13]OGM38822.1 MAG: hypothetical protein A3E13_01270 [Candidatus Woesebacteria bacterium RIFCSPHIGHO2_12_FULL_40_20]OGM65828.1 MAG: hypothetical protein A2962_01685 [Candidatus Woesebacteria bacterium RIFCSPLOWO2_01_FULL_39_61]OGM71642.1 MAG: hypothetical protein A3H19_04990 [Candidatus
MKKSSVKVKKEINKSNNNLDKVIGEVVGELLDLMEIKAGIEVVDDKENSAYLVNIDAPDEAGLLIGNRGRTMLDFQAIVGMIVKRKTGDWYRIIVNIGDWREKENVKLEELAKQAADRAKETGEPQLLYNLTPSQRRTIHVYLSQFNDVETKSEGEGEGRYLIVTAR